MEEKVFVPAEIQNDAKLALSKIIPKKSKDIYEKEFILFKSWREDKGVSGINEEILLAYFVDIGKKNVGSSMWTKYSMLKATLKLHKNVDISKYGRLIYFLKSESRAHKPKKAKILEKEHIEQFLKSAPDSEYLMEKVALIMGIAGACRCNELRNLSVEHIEDKGAYLYISIPDTKTNKPRSFTIINEGYPVSPIDLYRKYVSLRPAKVPHRRFFLNYKHQKCTIQPVGINILSKVPFRIASYLKLPQAEAYTGHSLRRSSATLLVNGGGDITALKRHGGWKSSTVAEGYIEESLGEKINTARKIQGKSEFTIATVPSAVVNSAESSNEISNNKINCQMTRSNNGTIDININININK